MGRFVDFPPAGRRRRPRPGGRFLRLALGGALAGLLGGCATPGVAPSGAPSAGARTADDLMIVDCLLPGQVRKIGRSLVYLTPQRPIRTTAADCEIRGGEYVAYDRADYRTALRVWLPQAQTGDPEAQTYVGEIYEKGLGRQPDYALAAEWYRRAAEQGYSRAQINLGYLYEKGLGVPRDPRQAIQWYRRASGLTAGLALEEGPDGGPLTREVEQLRRELARRQEELEALHKELAELRGQAGAQADPRGVAQRVAELEAQVVELRRRARPPRPTLAELPPVELGRYYALIVGNDDYAHLPKLQTAVRDARTVDRLLRERYGFRTRLLVDATEYELLAALDEFRENLGPGDNFLLYYAGHGELDEINLRGYWLPVEAERRNRASWVANEVISDFLNAMAARHILVIADSCYSGVMTGLSVPRLRPGGGGEVLRESFRTLVGKRSRTVLTSGGLAPVLDVGTGDHSIFAEVLLDLLEENAAVLQGKALHDEVAPTVSLKARTLLGQKQDPGYAALERVGHEGGDFLFVPVAGARSGGGPPGPADSAARFARR
ncbi:MAG: hypothetical protein Kow0092_38840 [Deferrisomatales bacterium]